MVCFVSRRMIPIDKHFVFPDKLSSSALWRLALSKWDDCLHPSTFGYLSLAENLAGKLSRDISKMIHVMMQDPPPPVDVATPSGAVVRDDGAGSSNNSSALFVSDFGGNGERELGS
jgi:hypothetical protein